MTRWRIMFDYDDTLIRHDNEQEISIMLKYLGVDVTVEIKQEIVQYYTKIANLFTKRCANKKEVDKFMLKTLPFLQVYGISCEKFIEAQQYKDQHYSMLMEGAIETLEYLKSKNYFLCIFTNWFYNEQVVSLKAQGIYDYFDRIYSWDNFYAKPDKRAFVRALSGTSPAENIMIGNSIENDIIPALKLGIYTFGINLNSKGKVMPDIELKTLTELKKYL